MFNKMIYTLLVLILMFLNSAELFSIDCNNLEKLVKITVEKNYNDKLKLDTQLIRESFVNLVEQNLDPQKIFLTQEDMAKILTEVSRKNPRVYFKQVVCESIEELATVYYSRKLSTGETVRKILTTSNSLDDIFPIDTVKEIETDTQKLGFLEEDSIESERLRPVLRYDVIEYMNKGASFDIATKQVLDDFMEDIKRFDPVNFKIGNYYDLFLKRFVQVTCFI